jgi:hypothetical protein
MSSSNANAVFWLALRYSLSKHLECIPYLEHTVECGNKYVEYSYQQNSSKFCPMAAMYNGSKDTMLPDAKIQGYVDYLTSS